MKSESGLPLKVLSMGMSETSSKRSRRSTMIRVGSSLFGNRTPQESFPLRKLLRWMEGKDIRMEMIGIIRQPRQSGMLCLHLLDDESLRGAESHHWRMRTHPVEGG